MIDRHRNFSMRYEPMRYVLKELQDAAEFGKDAPYVVQSIACAVANLISAAGKSYGDIGMKNMMDLVSQYGFHPEFYPNEIRVTFVAKVEPTPEVTYNGVPFSELSAFDKEKVNQGILLSDQELGE
jgi:hypothetical protein